MRKILLASAALVAFAGIAGAHEFTIQGVRAQACTITSAAEVTHYTLNLDNLQFQQTETLLVNCNYDGSANITLSSANSGKIVSEHADSVAYVVSGPGNTRDGLSLSTPKTYAVPSVTQNAVLVKLASVATRAGTYKDVITATVSP